jgi:hypothetical protein
MLQGTYAIFSILEEYLFFLLVDVADNGGGRMRYREILRVKQGMKASGKSTIETAEIFFFSPSMPLSWQTKGTQGTCSYRGVSSWPLL